MIKSVHIISKKHCKVEVPLHKTAFKCDIQLHYDVVSNLKSFDLEIVFHDVIAFFRNHDYTWVDGAKDRMANWYSPKLLKLGNGVLVQANRSIGIWKIHKQKPYTLLWRFNPENANPITQFHGENHLKEITSAHTIYDFNIPLSLLFTSNFGIEVSRSKIPFSSILCFTDHCDFDTLENLKQQRHFFAEHHIKVTKGFFLNDYSKRENNASFEDGKDEFVQWKTEGHELAYHSLSQSIKPKDAGFSDFKTFEPPFQNVRTWIDHGYQPYNFSCLKASKVSEASYETILIEKTIEQLWNYIDTGVTTQAVINQINPEHFTLKAYYKGIKGLNWTKRLALLIKNYVFYYSTHQEDILLYKTMVSNFRRLKHKRIWRFHFIISIFKFLNLIRLAISGYVFHSHTIYPSAKYTPLFFRHTIKNKDFIVFQTLEMTDLSKSLNKKTIDTLIHEKGICIAHTYFSVPMAYHHGKLFNKNSIATPVASNFNYIAQKIKNDELWNPCLSELIAYLSPLEHLIFDINEEGNINLKSDSNLTIRRVT